ncbi:hypothetical protein [Serratia marcescens]|uniref:hypothetical protein n=1 Tax=Serratia marcescens TaxID=615 RepID=UPI0027E49C49|nr:hypothetical protein [Serratia marcescens]HCL5501398.1 DUF2190 family protein [Klebsiella pneumoniae]EJC0203874.1 DUF2190 family protein [Serratia marcescens]WLS21824.1 hypothetical protein RAA91_11985 [Serratia marcescens]HCB1481485.1 DUF2190 family protein [Serratia marcescens]HCB1611178.1 DUF2190 family protein [Serratia marcescens]
MNIPGLITCHKTEVALAARRLVTHGSVPDEITLAVDSSKLIIGVTTIVTSDVGEPTDVVRSQLTPVVYGADIVAGDPLTADAEGRAVKATSGFYLGFAEYDGAEGDIGSVWIAPGQLTAAAGGGG